MNPPSDVLAEIANPSVEPWTVVEHIKGLSESSREICFQHIAGMIASEASEQRRRGAHLASQITLPVRYVPQLTAALRDPDDHVRFSAAWALVRLGPEALAALEALVGCFEDGRLPVRDRAAWAVTNIGAPAVPTLLKCTDSSSVLTRALAVGCIGAIIALGRRRPASLPDADARALAVPLLALVSDDQPWVRVNAARALGSLHMRFVVPAMVELLESDEEDVRERAMMELDWASPRLPPEASVAIEKHLEDASWLVRGHAREALRRMGRNIGRDGEQTAGVAPD